MTDLLALLLCAAALGWAVRVLTLAAIDGHRRGLARVHAGRSWECRCAYSRLDHADGLCQRREP